MCADACREMGRYVQGDCQIHAERFGQRGAEMWTGACREMGRDVQMCAQMHAWRWAESCIDPGRSMQRDWTYMCR